MFFYSRNEIECEGWDEMMMGESDWIKEYYMLNCEGWDEMMMRESDWIKEYYMLNFNFELNHKCVCVYVLLKWGVSLTSVQIIGSLDLKIKIREPNQTITVLVGSVLFSSEPNKVGYFFGLIGFVQTTYTPSYPDCEIHQRFFRKRSH